MAYIDAHFHIWELDRFDYSWLTDAYPDLNRNYSADDIENEMISTPLKYAVFVQVMCKKPEETRWVMEVAKKHNFIKGIVGGLDLTSPELTEILDDLQKNTLFKGCRHLTDYEEEQWILREDVLRGLKVLEDRGLTLDLPILSHQLKFIPTLLKRLPKLKIVLNHLARPDMKDGSPISLWKENISAIAAFPNVYCKLAGFVTSGDHIKWKKEDFQRFIDHAISCFGIDRCMFGSDWPVCTLAARSGYADVYKLLNDLLPSLSDEDKDKLFRENAKKFYSIQL